LRKQQKRGKIRGFQTLVNMFFIHRAMEGRKLKKHLANKRKFFMRQMKKLWILKNAWWVNKKHIHQIS